MVDIAPASQFLFLAWFTHTEGTFSEPDERHWFTGQGTYSGDTAELVVYETSGGRFDDSKETETVKVGTASIDFTDCNNAQSSYLLPDEGKEGEIDLTRALPGGEALCEEFSGEE